VDRAVDVRLGGEVNDRVDLFLAQQLDDAIAVVDVGVDEAQRARSWRR